MKNTIHIRKATAEDAAGIARVHVDTWKSAYAGIMPEALLASLKYEDREKRHRELLSDPNCQGGWWVAVDPFEKIVGFACGWKNRAKDAEFDCELYAIYVDPRLQKRGIGRLLFAHFVQEVKSAGFRSLKLWVLRDNPSRGFYESLGAELLGETKEETFGDKSLVEVAYGWSSLPSIDTLPI